MPFSRSRNSITVFHDGDVWRATLGSDANTGVSSTSDDPFKAMELTIGKAREQGWKFDPTSAKGQDDATEDAPADPHLKAAKPSTPAAAKAQPTLPPAPDKPATPAS